MRDPYQDSTRRRSRPRDFLDFYAAILVLGDLLHNSEENLLTGYPPPGQTGTAFLYFSLSAFLALPLTSPPMSVLIVGSTALDSIKTPNAENPRLLGGSASHAAVAASFFSPVKLVGVVGKDFPRKYVTLYKRHKIDLEGLQIEDGKTFHWSGEYEVNMNNRRTLLTELGVFEKFTPHLPENYKSSPFVLLANIAPALQHHVLDQMTNPKFIVADTMDLWLNIAKDDLLKLIKRVHAFVLNDSEAHQLTESDNVFAALKKIHKLGPKYVIIK